MKNEKFRYLILFIGVLVFACDGFLDEKPQAILGTSTFYQTESDALMAVNAVYDKLNKRYVTNRSLWVFGDIPTPDTETPASEAPITIIDNFTLGTSSEDIDNFWPECYEAINRANLVIEKVPPIDMDETLKTRLINEVKFLRGWFYFLLYKVYGEVPLVTEVIDPGDRAALTQGKASTEEIFTQIEKDFSDAEALPASYKEENTGRATSGAAKAYLAMAYLFQEKWQLASDKAQEVISSGEYQLEPSFRDATWNKNTKESIFELQSIKSNSGGWEDENEGNTITIWHRPSCLGGWGVHFGTQDLYNSFEDGDPRRSYTLLATGETYNGQELTDECLPDNTYALLKLMGDPQYGDAGDTDAGQNYPFMRLSEVYLMKAEADAELNNLTAAEEALEVVRKRAREDANAGPGAVPELTGLSQSELIAAIRHERRVELASEMKRFFDLVRWGIAGEVNRADGKPFVDGKHEKFPIPQSQIDISEGNLIQNPGY